MICIVSDDLLFQLLAHYKESYFKLIFWKPLNVDFKSEVFVLFIISLIGGAEFKLIYRHYATLFFVFCVDSAESELGILDLIQASVCVSEFKLMHLQFAVLNWIFLFNFRTFYALDSLFWSSQILWEYRLDLGQVI